MRKSAFYIRWGFALWTISILWLVLSVVFYYRFKALRDSLSFLYPFIGFGIFYIGIKMAVKGTKLKAIEEGKLSEYLKAVSAAQRRPKVWPYMLAIYLIIAIILIVINLLKG
jgi:hypothetical protein